MRGHEVDGLKIVSHSALQNKESSLHKVGFPHLLPLSKSPILEMNFFERTTMKSCPDAFDPTPFQTSIVLISRPIYLVKVFEGKPSHS